MFTTNWVRRLAFTSMAVVFAACGKAATEKRAAPEPAASAAAATVEAPDVATAQMIAPWTGDLDGMVERRYVRMLVTFNRTNYFLDRAQQKGATYEAGRLFEEYLNRQSKTKIQNEPMTRVDKGLFAMASYNAGPTRIAALRRKAAQQGLDPNVWFGNVEVVAARDIGRETVDYVSNIYKYYVSYQLIVKQREARGRASGNQAAGGRRRPPRAAGTRGGRER